MTEQTIRKLCCFKKRQGGCQTGDDSAPLQQTETDRTRQPNFIPVLTQDVFTNEMYYPKSGLEINQDGGSPRRDCEFCSLDPLYHKAGFGRHTISICGMQQPNVGSQAGIKRMLHRGTTSFTFLPRGGLISSRTTQSQNHFNTENRGREGNHKMNPGMEEKQNLKKENAAIYIGL